MDPADVGLSGISPIVEGVAKDQGKKQIKSKINEISGQLRQSQPPTFKQLKEYEEQLKALKSKLWPN